MRNLNQIDASPAGALRRREWLGVAFGAVLIGAVPGTVAATESRDIVRSQHFPFGPVAPSRPIGSYPVRTHLNVPTTLIELLRGRVTALQLMFTGCSATCPIQGALFAQSQQELMAPPESAQFMSLSIDPLSDSPAALAAWLRKFSARPGWLAVAPRVADVDAIVALLGSGGEPRPAGTADPHTGQVYLIDPRGELVYRLASMPTPASINQAILAIARNTSARAR